MKEEVSFKEMLSLVPTPAFYQREDVLYLTEGISFAEMLFGVPAAVLLYVEEAL